jgi:DNA-binding Lrp family transcriptional regulator
MQQSVTLDDQDLAIVSALQENGALTNAELAEHVRLSPSQSSRRRTRLEETGVIRGYRAEIDPLRVGLGVTVYIQVTLATHSGQNAKRFRELVARTPAILEAHALTGDADYLVKVVVEDLPALGALVNQVLLPHESVERVRSNIVLETLKQGAKLPIGGR